jgi:hypothetical protein
MSDYDVYRDEYLRKQVADAHRPIDLFNNENDAFICPSCSQQFSLTQSRCIENKYEKSLVLSKCSECNEQLYFKLPEIKKKRVYLDQSIISRLHDVEVIGINKIDSSDWRERLLTKIHLAKRLQKACFIVSDIHVLETVPINDQNTKKSLWRFANSLAGGKISGDINHAFEFELIQLLDRHDTRISKSAINCYMDVEIDSWSIHSPILMTNSWRLQGKQNWITFRDKSQENFKQTLETQKQQAGLDATLEKCILLLKKLYLDDVLTGIKYCQILTNKQPSSSQLPAKNGYSSLIFQATRDYQDGSEQFSSLNKLSQQINFQGINAFPSLKIQAVLEAEVLLRWIQNRQINPKRFNENFGLSKIMDIQHIAVFLPIVDVLTVDKDSFNRCQLTEIKSEIDIFSTKLLRASENQDGLEIWLDELLAEPETDEFRCARRLFFGRNLDEELRHDEKWMQEILSEFSKAHSKNKV